MVLRSTIALIFFCFGGLRKTSNCYRKGFMISCDDAFSIKTGLEVGGIVGSVC